MKKNKYEQARDGVDVGTPQVNPKTIPNQFPVVPKIVSLTMNARGGFMALDQNGKLWVETFATGSVFPTGWELYKNQFNLGAVEK